MLSLNSISYNLDAAIMLVPFESPGVSDVGDAYVHLGFLTAYNSVASTVISAVKAQLEIHPCYTIVSTGNFGCLYSL
jgi:hypothetical protein